jgi:hypothetical protein
MDDTIYIGDAVYAHFDGYGIELKLDSHESKCAVYLEPEVMQNLIEFWEKSSERKVTRQSKEQFLRYWHQPHWRTQV